MIEKQAKKNSLRRELFCITNTFTHSLTHTHGSKMIELRRRYVRVHVRTLSERTCRAEKGTGITYVLYTKSECFQTFEIDIRVRTRPTTVPGDAYATLATAGTKP